MDPVNPPRGAGLTGSNRSECDLCAYMAGKSHFCTHCGTHTWMEIELVDFLYDARDEYDVHPFGVICEHHCQHGNSQGPKRSVQLNLKDLRSGSRSRSLPIEHALGACLNWLPKQDLMSEVFPILTSIIIFEFNVAQYLRKWTLG